MKKGKLLRICVCLLMVTAVFAVGVPGNVSAFNGPPIADAGADQDAVVGETVGLVGSAYDPDADDIVGWTWTIESAPAGSTATLIPGAYPWVTTFIPDVDGEYIISLVVYDGMDWGPADTATVTATGPIPPPPGMVSWWPMDGSVEDIVDGNDPSDYDRIHFVPGMVDEGVSFESIDRYDPGGYIDIPQSENLELQEFTIDAWVRPDGPGPNGLVHGSSIIIKNLPQPTGGVTVSVALLWYVEDCKFRFLFGNRDYEVVFSDNDCVPGYWYHVAASYDGDTFKLYVNGDLEGTKELQKTIYYDSSFPWVIGAMADYYRTRGWPRTWNGVIDEVEIFNRALSISEILDIYNAGSGGKIKYNTPPIANADGPYLDYEGTEITLDASSSYDPEGDLLQYRWDFENDGIWDTEYSTEPTALQTWNDDYSGFVAVEVFDGALTSTATAEVTIDNADPIITSITSPIDPIPIDTPTDISAPFTDPGTMDTHTAQINWGDGAITDGVVDETGGSGTVTGHHTYDTPGVYLITLTVCDYDGGEDSITTEYVVQYDPYGAFVTGGGMIDSPEGAYYPDSSLTGKAGFGFVSKYKKGATVPDGNTQFRFQTADLKFQSTSYDWMVVAGPKAMFKGSGTINGEGDYGFLLSAIDGEQNGGGGVDKFRIKIWDKVSGDIIYDNEMGEDEYGDPTTTLTHGSIKIHKA